MNIIEVWIGRLLVFFIAVSISGVANAQGNNCDCQEIIGSCSASITIIPTKSEKGSYAVDLLIQSSAPLCAKVDYYIDSTPYFSILSQGNRATDSSWGQKPITRANITGISCKVCKQVLPAGSQGNQTHPNTTLSSPTPVEAIDLTGTWNSLQTCSYGSGTSVLTIKQSAPGNGTISGSLANATIDSGQVNGNTITIRASNWLGNRVSMDGRVVSPTRITGTYTQTAQGGVCQWEATKN